MEDMKKQQLEVLEEAKDYCQKVLHCIDTVIPEIRRMILMSISE